jgi:hypothetical protein
MKSFKEYLTESKKIYEFKVKIAGDCPTDCSSQIKAALAQFHVSSVSAGKRTPIQERHSEFPEHKNVNMTIFDVTTDYPATNKQIHDIVASGLGMPANCIKVKNMAEELEHEINHEHDIRTGKALVGTIQTPSDNSHLVGEKHKMNFLQELNKEKHQGTQVKGYNDEILAPSVPGAAKEYRKSTKESTVEKAHRSPVAKRPADPIKG